MGHARETKKIIERVKPFDKIKMIWFDLSVYYDLSSVQIHKTLYKF